MSSDVQGNPQIPESQLRFKQKEGKVWQALVLISRAFVEPCERPSSTVQGRIRREFLERLLLWAISLEVLHDFIALTILH